jgi:APA family basic amino acid/polyamine antiporter
MLFFEKKAFGAIEKNANKNKKEKNLTAFELIAIGVGSMIGSGIFSATPVVAATDAGPGIFISYLFAGIIALFVALMYVEMVSKLPAKGGLYDYTYVAFGQIFAWFIFTCIMLELIFGAAFSAVALVAYILNLLGSMSIHFPHWYLNSEPVNGIINLPCLSIVVPLIVVLSFGTVGGKLVRRALFIIKMLAILMFTVTAIKYCKVENLSPLLPFGWKGVFVGSGTLFICFYGFSPLVVLVDECKNPKKDMLTSLIGSVVITCVVYVVVSIVIVSLRPYYMLNNVVAVLDILTENNSGFAKLFVYLAGIIGMIFIILFFIESAVRTIYSAIEDKLFPSWMAKRFFLMLFVGLIICFFAQRFTFEKLMQINAIAICINYLFIAVVVMFFRTNSKLVGEFQCPYIYLLAPFVIIFNLFLIYKRVMQDHSVGYSFLTIYAASFLYYLGQSFYRRLRKAS